MSTEFDFVCDGQATKLVVDGESGVFCNACRETPELRFALMAVGAAAHVGAHREETLLMAVRVIGEVYGGWVTKDVLQQGAEDDGSRVLDSSGPMPDAQHGRPGMAHR